MDKERIKLIMEDFGCNRKEAIAYIQNVEVWGVYYDKYRCKGYKPLQVAWASAKGN